MRSWVALGLGLAAAIPAFAAEPIRVSPDRTPAPPGIELETQAEPHVAVSPKNSLHVAVAWQDGRFPGFGAAHLGFAFSKDGGATWKATRVPRLTQSQGGSYLAVTDPWVGIDTKGRIFVAALVQKTSGSTAIVVSSTADRGTTWRGPVVVHDTGAFDDKVSLTIDTSATSASRDTVYVGWSINHVPVVARSTDQGRTFGPPVPLSPSEFGLGVVLACADDGRLHAVWQGADGSGTALRAVFSDDRGATWSTATTVGSVVSAGVEGVRTGDGLPSLAILGQRPFVVWQDGRFSPQEIVHVALASSTDGGLSWSAPRRISGGPLAAANFLPAIARDRAGRLSVAFLSLRNDPARSWLADVYFVSSRDGGKTFAAARRLTPRTFDLREAAQSAGRAFVGDYFGLAGGARFHALFVGPWLPSVTDPGRRQPDVLAVSVDG